MNGLSELGPPENWPYNRDYHITGLALYPWTFLSGTHCNSVVCEAIRWHGTHYPTERAEQMGSHNHGITGQRKRVHRLMRLVIERRDGVEILIMGRLRPFNLGFFILPLKVVSTILFLCCTRTNFDETLVDFWLRVWSNVLQISTKLVQRQLRKVGRTQLLKLKYRNLN